MGMIRTTRCNSEAEAKSAADMCWAAGAIRVEITKTPDGTYTVVCTYPNGGESTKK